MILSNGYQPVNNHRCPESPGFASDKILLLSEESLLKGEDKKKKKKKKKKKSNINKR